MTHNPKPAMITRTPFSQQWRVVTHWKDMDGGAFEAVNTRDVHPRSAAILDEMADAHAWLTGLMQETGKTRDEIAATFGLVMTPKAD